MWQQVWQGAWLPAIQQGELAAASKPLDLREIKRSRLQTRNDDINIEVQRKRQSWRVMTKLFEKRIFSVLFSDCVGFSFGVCYIKIRRLVVITFLLSLL